VGKLGRLIHRSVVQCSLCMKRKEGIDAKHGSWYNCLGFAWME